MRTEIDEANKKVIDIFNYLKKKYTEKDFNFGVVFYRDLAYALHERPHDNNNYNDSGSFNLTGNMNKLQNFISTIHTHGGFGYGGDWVSGYGLALNKINWRKGNKLIIHIADDGAHGEEFTKKDPLPEEGLKLTNLIKKCVDDNINIISFKIGEKPRQSFEKDKEIYDEYKL